MKRSLSTNVCFNTRSKKPRLHGPLEIKRKVDNIKWISATKTYNYMINDHLVDWLSLYGKKERSLSFDLVTNSTNTFDDFIKKKGIEFEKRVIDKIKEKYPVITISDFYTVETANETIKHMKNGTPIIHSAPIYNKKNKTYGIIDLLVRNDYINKLFNDFTLDDKTVAPKLNNGYHYRVIEIKYVTLYLSNDGIHIKNTNKFPAYKSQLHIYNEAVANVQGYTPDSTYILGRRWNYVNNYIKYQGESCFDKLGVINYETQDKSYIEKTKKAIQWYRNVLNNGMHWNISPPSIPELYPNMSVNSGEWNYKKEKIAENLNDITLLWNCGIKHRTNAIDNGVSSWKDNKCNGKILGLTGERENIINKILEVNKSDKLFLPDKIQNNYNNWLETSDDNLYVDFETFSDICTSFDDMPKQPVFNIIYMIGVGYYTNGKWFYKSFVCEKPTYEEEYKIMNQFMEFVNTYENPRIFYWNAEKTFWEKSCDKQFELNEENSDKKDDILMNWIINDWVDLCKIFKKESIAIKGVFGYGLKPIAKQMKKHGMIKTYLESECKNGMMAMVKVWNCYNNMKDPINSPIMKDIIKYNEFDCRVLYDIVKYVRNNHT